MTAKHTPGPWVEYHDGDGDESSDIVQSLTGDPKDDVCYMALDRPVSERHANARLIASAPELLEALTALLGTARVVDASNKAQFDTPAGFAPELFEQARAAIAKATTQ